MCDFDSSDDEREVDQTPLKIDWCDLTRYGLPGQVGVTSLPGCRSQKIWRDLDNDLAQLRELAVQDVFTLMCSSEFEYYRVPDLLSHYQNAGLTVHHYPVIDGDRPDNLTALLEQLCACLHEKSSKAVIHCYGGLGRSCTVLASLLMYLDPDMLPGTAIDKMKDLRGPSAIQSIRQYNFLHDFRELRDTTNGAVSA